MTSAWQQWIDGAVMAFVKSVEDSIVNDDNPTTTSHMAMDDVYERNYGRHNRPSSVIKIPVNVTVVRSSGLLMPLIGHLYIDLSDRQWSRKPLTSEAMARQLIEADRPVEILKQYQEGNHGEN